MKTLARRLPAAVVALAGLGLAGCDEPARPARADGAPVVLISIDTLRSDRLPAYGYGGVATPGLDDLVADSVLFERAYSHYPLTLPSHASILTGVSPARHGVRDNRDFVLGEEHPTLAERLLEAGYRTAGFVSCMVLRRGTGMERGFETYDDDMPASVPDVGRLFPERDGEITVERARRWIAGVDTERPFFLFVHLFEPHTPYEAPEPFASRYADPYDAEIGYADRLVGRLLDELRERGLYDRAMIILLSDHGEGLGDHVESEHGLLVYREVLQVPLVIKLPGQRRAGTRLETPVALMDVVPTALDVLALDAAELSGRALFGGQSPPGERTIYSETFYPRYQFGWSPLRSVIAGDLHYIEAPRDELYDLVEDPAERRNLAGERPVPSVVTELLEALGDGAGTVVKISEEDRARLAALGYVGGFEASGGPGVAVDPKDRIREAEELRSLMRRLGTDRTLGPENRVLDLMADLGVRNERLSRAIARSALAAGQPDRAREVLESWDSSDDPATQVLLGAIATARGRSDDAIRRFRTALSSRPDLPEAAAGLGVVLVEQGRFDEAGPHLEGAVERNPELSDAWSALGIVRARNGDVDGAVEAWKRAVEIEPRLDEAWFNLAVTYGRFGNRDGAVEALERYSELADGPERETALRMLAELRGEP